MSNQTHDLSDDVHFATSDSSPSSPASTLVPTRSVSPCSPVIRPNFFLPRSRTPPAVALTDKQSSPASMLVPTSLVSPCSPVIRPNFFLPRSRTPPAVALTDKQNRKDHSVSSAFPADVYMNQPH
jgi:hypothetical protein